MIINIRRFVRIGLALVLSLLACASMPGGLLRPTRAQGAVTTRVYQPYIPDTATNLGADGTANFLYTGTTASKPAPTVRDTMRYTYSATTSRYTPTLGMATNVTTTLMRLYAEPPYAANGMIISSPSLSCTIRGTSNNDAWTFHLYDYDPNGVAGNKTLIATSATVLSTGTTVTTVRPSYTITNGGIVDYQHRLLMEITYKPVGATFTPRVYLDGNTAATRCRLSVTETDTSPPTITSTSPANSATSVALNSSVTITWNNSIDCTTVNTTNITMSSGGWALSLCSGNTATFTSSGQANNTTYTVTVGTGVKDIYGNPMAASYPFSYTTVAPADSTPPTSSITAPAGGATLNFASSPFTITGTAADNAGGSGIGTSGIQVSMDNGSTWNTAVCSNCPTTGNATANWSYNWTLPSENAVSHTIRSRATDQGSNAETPGAGVTITVNTVKPTVSSLAVVSGLTVSVTFNKAMGAGVTTATNYALSGTGMGTLANNPNSVALVSGNTYLLTWAAGEMVDGGNITITVANALDTAGNPMGAPSSGTHTGGGIGTIPTVSSTIPTTGANGVTKNASITITFSENVNCATVSPVNVVSISTGTITYSSCVNNIATFTTSSQAASTSYSVLISSAIQDVAGNPLSAPYGWSYTTAAAGPPTPPTGISLSNMRTNGPTITWNTVAGAAKYVIYRSTDGLTWSSPTGTVDDPTTTYTDSSAPLSNTLYYWTVTAWNGSGESAKPAAVPGLTALLKGYNLISAPTATVSSISAQFGAWANWAWIWQSTSNTNPDTSGIWVNPTGSNPGQGIFEWAYNDSTVLNATGGTPPASVTVTLLPGWNLISNQTTTNMPYANIRTHWMVDASTLSAAVTGNLISNALYWWDGSTSPSWNFMTDNINAVEPWKGYWILNMDTVSHNLTIKQ